ncbi:hypothetical protein XA68_17452 [Ophiocordyceps unilateralis]|uniref:Uncharacterized protein n=1 Tax=Ophiocordyceps unilateralis TaxID=268505 RepID=A0A2A9PKJ7_OPHUN|nr:hypothetical protein XA68_17452 [Ophiocordyceps unilateralis]
MKFASAIVVALSAATTAFQKISPVEQQDWRTCIYNALDNFDHGNDGSDVACSTYECYQKTGEKWSRGGLLNKAGSLLLVGCKFLPFQSHHQAQKVTPEEENEWKLCLNNLLQEYQLGRDDRHSSCQFWRCLQTKSEAYHRGGIATSLSHLVDGVCLFA